MPVNVVPPEALRTALTQTSTNSPAAVSEEVRKSNPLIEEARKLGFVISTLAIVLEANNFQTVVSTLKDFIDRMKSKPDDFVEQVKALEEESADEMSRLILAFRLKMKAVLEYVKDNHGQDEAELLAADMTRFQQLYSDILNSNPELVFSRAASRHLVARLAPVLELVINGVSLQIHHELDAKTNTVRIKDVELAGGLMASQHLSAASSHDRQAFLQLLIQHVVRHHASNGLKVSVEAHPESAFLNDFAALAAGVSPQPSAPSLPFNYLSKAAKDLYTEDSELLRMMQTPTAINPKVGGGSAG